MVIAGTGSMRSWNIITVSIPAAENVVTVIKTLYFLVRFRKIEPKTAPTAPKIIKPTADKEIVTSLKPKGLIRKLALEPKMRKVP
jgi:hypothetical protein